MTNLEKHLETLANRLDDRLFDESGLLLDTIDRTEVILSVFTEVALTVIANQKYPLDRSTSDEHDAK